MECYVCGSNIPEGDAFCTVCGAKAEEPVEELISLPTCPNCGAIAEYEAKYCVTCGTRLDGKEECKKCGNLYKGHFCPRCGEPAPKRIVVKNRSARKYRNIKETSLENAERLVSPILLIFGIMALLICSFFINANQSNGIFYYFGQAYKDLVEIPNLTTLDKLNLFFPLSVTTFAFLINFIVCVTTLIVASVKYAKAVANKEECRLTKLFTKAFSTFLFASCISVLFNGFNVQIMAQTIEEINFVDNLTGIIVGISVALALAIASAVLRLITKGNDGNVDKTVFKAVMGLVIMALAIVAMFVGAQNVLVYEETGIILTYGLANASIAFVGTTTTATSLFILFAIVSYALFAIMLTSVVSYAYKSAVCKEKCNKLFAVSVMSVISIGLVLLFSLLLKARLPEVFTDIGFGLIGAMAIAVIVLIFTVVYNAVISYFRNKNLKFYE